MITILESTNIFNSTTQTYESIMTGDMRDSKIIFQSDQLNTLSSLTFKVELYFDSDLIFETITPILYESGTTIGISNIDLSRPIRDYLITQTGISKYDDDIETQYNNFRKINNDAQLIIYEYDTGVEISGYTFNSYIYKTIEKATLIKPYFYDGASTLARNDLFLQRYIIEQYSYEDNLIDNARVTSISNSIHPSADLFFNFYIEDPYKNFTFIELFGTIAGSYVKIISANININDTFTFRVNKETNLVNIFPTIDLKWEYFDGTTIYSGTDFSILNTHLTSDNFDVVNFSMNLFNDSYGVKRLFEYTIDCSKYPHQLRWLNMLGGYDTFNFDLIHQETVQVSDKGYYQNNYGLTDSISTNDLRSSYQSYDRKFNKKYTFKTDWLTADQIYLLEDIFKSNEIYYLNSDLTYGKTPEWVAMKNLTKTQELYHKDKFGLKRYEITVEESLKKEII